MMTGNTRSHVHRESGSSKVRTGSCGSAEYDEQQGGCAMNGEPLQRKVVIRNPHGFHVRPAAAFVEAAARFRSRITLCKGDLRVDGRRVLDLIMLAAESGAELVLEALGPDALEAIEVLSEIVEATEPPIPPLPKKG